MIERAGQRRRRRAVAAEKLDPGVLGYFAGWRRRRGDPARERRGLAPLAAAAAGARRARTVERARPSCSAQSSRCRSSSPRSPTSAWSTPRGRSRWPAPPPRRGPRCASRPWPPPGPARSPPRLPAARRWFQLYCFSDAAVTRALMDEAVARASRRSSSPSTRRRGGQPRARPPDRLPDPGGPGVPSVAGGARLGAGDDDRGDLRPDGPASPGRTSRRSPPIPTFRSWSRAS